MDVQGLDRLSEVRSFVPNLRKPENKKKNTLNMAIDFFYYMDSVGTPPDCHMTLTDIKLHHSTHRYSLKPLKNFQS